MQSSDPIKSAVQQQFGRTAERYVTSPGHARGHDLPLLVKWLSPQRDWIALDIATGGGHVAKTLSPHVKSVYAIDLTKPMLESARVHLSETGCGNVVYVLADAEQLPFLDASFDVVTCRIAPHHFPNPDRFVRESARVLKPGGKFLLIDNVSPDHPPYAEFINTLERLRDESHVRCPSIREWSRWLSEADLSILKTKEERRTFEFQPWVRRMVEAEEQIDQIERFITAAPADVRAYFAITKADMKVQSLQVDTWMVMCEKTSE